MNGSFFKNIRCAPKSMQNRDIMSLTIKHTGLRDVPHSCSLHNVPDDKLLDGLVLRHAAGTVGAADGLDVATSLLRTPVIPPFLGLKDNFTMRDEGRSYFFRYMQ